MGMYVMKKIFIFIMSVLLSSCFSGKKFKFVHMDFPDHAPEEMQAGDLSEDDEQSEEYSEPAEDNSVTEGDIMEAENTDSETASSSSDSSPEPPEPQNFGGDGKITIRRNGTKESITVRYRNKDGSYDREALKKINHIMRCYDDDSEQEMAIKLIELLDAVDDNFGRKGITFLSGYRTPEYNGKVKGAVKNSMHILGWAADIRIPGVSSLKIANYARKKYAGGVGYYRYSGFVHIDVGTVRYWTEKPPKKNRKRTAARSRTAKSAASKRRAPAKPSAKKPAAKTPVRKTVQRNTRK